MKIGAQVTIFSYLSVPIGPKGRREYSTISFIKKTTAMRWSNVRAILLFRRKEKYKATIVKVLIVRLVVARVKPPTTGTAAETEQTRITI